MPFWDWYGWIGYNVDLVPSRLLNREIDGLVGDKLDHGTNFTLNYWRDILWCDKTCSDFICRPMWEKLSLYLHLHYARWCISNLSASTSLTGFVPLFLLLQLHLAFARPLFPLPSKTKNEEKRPMQTFRPYNIAHRGSNGEIPEETAAAYLVLLRKLQSRKIIAGFHFFYFANGKRIFFISRYT